MTAIATAVRFVMACAAANKDSKARCRNHRCEGGRYCITHEAATDVQDALAPDVVLAKRTIGLNWVKKLLALGIKEEEGTDPTIKFARAAAAAQAIGRVGDVYDQGTGRRDSGSLLFSTPGGKKGDPARQITVSQALVDLREGYDITHVHLELTGNPNTRKLVVTRTRRKAGMAMVLDAELDALIMAIFTGIFDIWVYSNPPKNGIVVDTVNLGRMCQKEKPSDPEITALAHLRFDGDVSGVWDLEVSA